MIQSVLIFGPESWVINPFILRDLIISQNWVERSTYIRIFWCRNRKWDYPSIGEALVDKGVEPIGEYISLYHISVAQ